MNSWDNSMTVKDLITELLFLDLDSKIVVPGAPYDQPQFLERIGVVILKEDDPETGVPAGEYIGLNIGTDLDDDTFDEEAETPASHDSQEPHVFPPDLDDDPIEADTFEEFEENLIEQLTKK